VVWWFYDLCLVEPLKLLIWNLCVRSDDPKKKIDKRIVKLFKITNHVVLSSTMTE